MEASNTLYQRPISFSTQANFFSWIQKNPQHDLQRVKNITLRLTEIDVSPLYATRHGKHTAGPTAWDLYQKELERLDHAVQQLPGLECLTIISPARHNMFVRGMYESFLDCVSVRCLRIKRLVLYDDEDVLRRVPRLGRIAKVVFEGQTGAGLAWRKGLDGSKSLGGKMKVEDVQIKTEKDEEFDI